jgi:flagellar motor switch protein FliG
MTDNSNFNRLSGSQKAAIVLLAIEEANAAKVFELMTDEEVRDISIAMSNLGSVRRDTIDRILIEFVTEINSSATIMGSSDVTERLLEKVLGRDKLSVLMEEIRGPAGRNTWDKLGNVNEDILANYLKNEHPQTISLIISKLTSGHAAKILATLPESITLDVMLRLLSMEPVKKEVLDGVERTLRTEFISTLSRTQKADSTMVMAEIFNNFDRNTEAKYMGMLEEKVPEAAEKIKSLMFTFEDLTNIDDAGIQTLLRTIDKTKLTVALKGASEKIRNLFMKNMSQRAAKIMVEDMAALGPVRLRDVDEAQAEIITMAKDQAAKGEIVIADANAKDEFIY